MWNDRLNGYRWKSHCRKTQRRWVSWRIVVLKRVSEFLRSLSLSFVCVMQSRGRSYECRSNEKTFFVWYIINCHCLVKIKSWQVCRGTSNFIRPQLSTKPNTAFVVCHCCMPSSWCLRHSTPPPPPPPSLSLSLSHTSIHAYVCITSLFAVHPLMSLCQSDDVVRRNSIECQFSPLLATLSLWSVKKDQPHTGMHALCTISVMYETPTLKYLHFCFFFVADGSILFEEVERLPWSQEQGHILFTSWISSLTVFLIGNCTIQRSEDKAVKAFGVDVLSSLWFIVYRSPFPLSELIVSLIAPLSHPRVLMMHVYSTSHMHTDACMHTLTRCIQSSCALLTHWRIFWKLMHDVNWFYVHNHGCVCLSSHFSTLALPLYHQSDFSESKLEINDKLPLFMALQRCPASHFEDFYPLHSKSGWRAFRKDVGWNIFKLEHPVRHYFGKCSKGIHCFILSVLSLQVILLYKWTQCCCCCCSSSSSSSSSSCHHHRWMGNCSFLTSVSLKRSLVIDHFLFSLESDRISRGILRLFGFRWRCGCILCLDELLYIVASRSSNTWSDTLLLQTKGRNCRQQSISAILRSCCSVVGCALSQGNVSFSFSESHLHVSGDWIMVYAHLVFESCLGRGISTASLFHDLVSLVCIKQWKHFVHSMHKMRWKGRWRSQTLLVTISLSSVKRRLWPSHSMLTESPAVILSLFTFYANPFLSFVAQFWRRHMSSVAFTWNTHDYSASEELRPEYWGEERISPITGRQEVHFPSSRRYARYFVSFLAMQPMLLIAVCAMLLSLNLNGYIKDIHSPVHIATLAKFAEPVGLSLVCVCGCVTNCLLWKDTPCQSWKKIMLVFWTKAHA